MKQQYHNHELTLYSSIKQVVELSSKKEKQQEVLTGNFQLMRSHG